MLFVPCFVSVQCVDVASPPTTLTTTLFPHHHTPSPITLRQSSIGAWPRAAFPPHPPHTSPTATSTTSPPRSTNSSPSHHSAFLLPARVHSRVPIHQPTLEKLFAFSPPFLATPFHSARAPSLAKSNVWPFSGPLRHVNHTPIQVCMVLPGGHCATQLA